MTCTVNPFFLLPSTICEHYWGLKSNNSLVVHEERPAKPSRITATSSLLLASRMSRCCSHRGLDIQQLVTLKRSASLTSDSYIPYCCPTFQIYTVCPWDRVLWNMAELLLLYFTSRNQHMPILLFCRKPSPSSCSNLTELLTESLWNSRLPGLRKIRIFLAYSSAS